MGPVGGQRPHPPRRIVSERTLGAALETFVRLPHRWRWRRAARLLTRLAWSLHDRHQWQPPRLVASTTLDVFDTVLVRRVGSADRVGHVLERRLTAARDGERFRGLAAARARASRAAVVQAAAESRCATHRDITSRLGAELGWPDRACQEVEAAEIALEHELAEVPGACRQLVDRVRREQGAVVFLSDMHLDAASLQQLLRGQGVWRDGDRVLVSCDTRTSKLNGGLYAIPGAVGGRRRHQHIGNDPRADGSSALRQGVRVGPFPAGNLTCYEQVLERHADQLGDFASSMAGAARLARLDGPTSDPVHASLRAVAAGVAGPMLYSFVLWTLRRAHEEGLDRLFFLSRDGEVLHGIAERLICALDLGVAASYLYTSREALNHAVAHRGRPEDIEWAWTHTRSSSVRDLLARLDLTPEGLAATLTSAGWEPDAWDVPVPRGRRGALAEAIAQSGSLVGDRRQRHATLRYLQHAGFLDGERVGVVDLSGHGSQIRTLGLVRESHGLPAPWGFHCIVGLADPAECPPVDDFHLEAYLVDFRLEDDPGPYRGLIPLLETFCAATHGTVLRYQETAGGGTRPVLLAERDEQVTAWGLDVVRETLDRFGDRLVANRDLAPLNVDMRAALVALGRALWDQPRVLDASVWGAFPFEGASGARDRATPLARGYSFGELLQRPRTIARPWFTWPAASAVLTPRPLRPLLRARLALLTLLAKACSWRG